MKLIYTNENSFLVSNIKNIVENNGLTAVLKNEFSGGGSGDLAPLDTWVELWVVNDADYDRAMGIIKNFQDSEVLSDWVCLSCGEENSGSFEFCWNCQKEPPK
ncbi:MAG: hypothetical protein COA46_01140 [Porticoccaceae bacterium]|nr:MAG: hypothetical protein COA46_01140 [Porticoccaceae bacterium]